MGKKEGADTAADAVAVLRILVAAVSALQKMEAIKNKCLPLALVM